MDIIELATEVGAVIGIVVLCYVIGMALKAWDTFDDRKIPVLMIAFGGAMGAIIYFVEPSMLVNVGGIISAIIKGVVSGLCATGINQVYKQARKGDVE